MFQRVPTFQSGTFVCIYNSVKFGNRVAFTFVMNIIYAFVDTNLFKTDYQRGRSGCGCWKLALRTGFCSKFSQELRKERKKLLESCKC